MRDGARVVFGFGGGVGNEQGLFWQAADNTGAAERLTMKTTSQEPTSVAPDGKAVVFTEIAANGGTDIMLLHLDTKQVKPLVADAGD